MEEGARERRSTAAGFPVNGERRPRANVQSGQETTSRPRAHRSSPPLPCFPSLPLLLRLHPLLLLFPPSSRRVAKGETAAAAATHSCYRAFVERTQRNNIFYVEK